METLFLILVLYARDPPAGILIGKQAVQTQLTP
jgi:hypothetical protein